MKWNFVLLISRLVSEFVSTKISFIEGLVFLLRSHKSETCLTFLIFKKSKCYTFHLKEYSFTRLFETHWLFLNTFVFDLFVPMETELFLTLWSLFNCLNELFHYGISFSCQKITIKYAIQYVSYVCHSLEYSSVLFISFSSILFHISPDKMTMSMCKDQC